MTKARLNGTLAALQLIGAASGQLTVQVNAAQAVDSVLTAPNGVTGTIALADAPNAWGGTQDFTGATILVPTATAGDSSTKAASTAFVTAAISVAGAAFLVKANNLSDIPNVATARTNLGLGTMATQNASAVAITGGTLTGTALDPTNTITFTAVAGVNAQQQTVLANAMRQFDALVQPGVISAWISAQPATPTNGDTYLIPQSPAPTGAAWTGQGGKVARYSTVAAAWEFYTAQNGWKVYARDTGAIWTMSGGTWILAEAQVGLVDRFRTNLQSGELFTLPNGINEFDVLWDGTNYWMFHHDFEDPTTLRVRNATTIAGLSSASDTLLSGAQLKYPSVIIVGGTWHLWGVNAAAALVHYTSSSAVGPWTLSDTVSSAFLDPSVQVNPANGLYYMAAVRISNYRFCILTASSPAGPWTDQGDIFSVMGQKPWHALSEGDSGVWFENGRIWGTFSGWDGTYQRIGMVEIDSVSLKAINPAIVLVEPSLSWQQRNNSFKVFNPVYIPLPDAEGKRLLLFAHNPSATGIATGWGYLYETKPQLSAVPISPTMIGAAPYSSPTFIGVAQFAAGTTAAPSINLGDTGTGIYRPAANQLGWSISGASAMTLTSSGLTVNNTITASITSTATSGSILGYNSSVNANPAAASSAQYYGGNFQANSSATAAGNLTNGSGGLIGGTFTFNHFGTGLLSLGLGGSFVANLRSGSGGATTMAAAQFVVQNLSATTLPTAYGINILSANNSGGGAITASYALIIQPQTVGGTNYAIYTAGAGLVKISDTTGSTSSTTGALVVAGGVGIGGVLYVAGNLVIGTNIAVAPTPVINGAAGFNRKFQFQTAGTVRWSFGAGSTTETGSGNTGTQFEITSFADGGTSIDIPLSIIRASAGLITIGGSSNRPTNFTGVIQQGGTQILTSQQTGMGANLAVATAGASYTATEQTMLQNVYNKWLLLEPKLKTHGLIAA